MRYSYSRCRLVVGRKDTTILFVLYGRIIYYDLILFLFNLSRDRVKDLAGSSCVILRHVLKRNLRLFLNNIRLKFGNLTARLASNGVELFI